MTTWAFNVVRELIARPESRKLWIPPGSADEGLFTSSDELVLAKCHHFSAQLAQAADIVVYSYRDMRAAAVSYHRKFGSACSREQLDNWVEAERLWLPFADLVLRYEEIERRPLEAVAGLRQLLAASAGAIEVSALSDAHILERVDTAFEEIQNTPRIAFDASTMILPAHRTFQPDAESLPPREKAIYDRVECDFALWLATHGYIDDPDHGQEIEYRIATKFLAAFTSPTVVDVGVERGSFTELALRAGSGMVIGFEPLPRHVEFLANRFRESPQVRIHPVAVSSSSGTAQFHIATDRAGNELDFHHSLSELGDSATVIRSKRTLQVETAALSDLVRQGAVPSEIHFLKVDTDGHDLPVLEGLGDVRPHVIMAEYWDTLPESSGRNLYTLQDLAAWARARGYSRIVVVRRHGRIQLLELDAAWTVEGDWGNVFFVRDDFAFSRVRADLEMYSRTSYDQLCGYVSALMRENEAKEAEIRSLDAAAQEMEAEIQEKEAEIQQKEAERGRLDAELAERQADLEDKESSLHSLREDATEKDAAIRELKTALDEKADIKRFNTTLEEKEAIIRDQVRALQAYRATFIMAGWIVVPLNHVILAARSFARGTASSLVPRLGVLYQHPPLEMRLPDRYARATASADSPKISIVTPSFKQATFIERTIRSVVEQGYPNLEYYVQDGGSDDGTVDVLKRCGEKQLSGWESRPDRGQAQAINRAFARTDGEIMAYLNSDDILLPGALAYVAEFLARHPDVDVVYGNRIVIDEDDRQIGRWILPGHDDKVLSWADFVPQETLFWRRRIWEKSGGRMDESFQFALDWDLLVRFRDAGARFARLPRFLGGFRVHAQQKTTTSIADTGFEEMNRIRQRALGRVPTSVEVRKAVAPYLMKHMAADLQWKLAARLGLQS